MTGFGSAWTSETCDELERFCDSTDRNVILCLYVLLRIANMLMQLLTRSNLNETPPALTFLAVRLLDDLRNAVLPKDLFAPNPPHIQDRLRQCAPLIPRSRETPRPIAGTHHKAPSPRRQGDYCAQTTIPNSLAPFLRFPRFQFRTAAGTARVPPLGFDGGLNLLR